MDETTLPSIVETAINKGASVEVIEKLLALQERFDANQARKAFSQAISDVRSDLPAITKGNVVDFTSARGRTHYRYEDLSAVVEALTPVLAEHGLSFRWRTRSDATTVFVTCILSHAEGHSEETELCCRHDDSGNKNPIQAIGSAVTYLQRYTLKAAIGIAASEDDDGQSAAQRKPPEKTLEQRREAVHAWVKTLGIDESRVWAALGIRGVAEIGLREIETLSGKRTAIKDGEVSVDEAFPPDDSSERLASLKAFVDGPVEAIRDMTDNGFRNMCAGLRGKELEALVKQYTERKKGL